MSKTLQFFMDRPELVAQLPVELQQMLHEAVKEQLARGQGWLPESASSDMEKAVPTDLLQAIVSDNRRGVSEPGWLPAAKGAGKVKGTGWSKPTPLEPPPGIKIMDRMMDVADAIDKRELEGKLGLKRRL